MKQILLPKIEDSQFWTRETPCRKLNSKKFESVKELYILGTLYREHSKNIDLESHTYSIAKGRFSYYKDNFEMGYVNLNDCKVEFMAYSSHKQTPFGFTLYHGTEQKTFYCDNLQDFQNWIMRLRKQCLQTNLERNFILGEQLGQGHFGTVYEAMPINNEQMQKVAVKVILKEKLKSEKHVQAVQDEVRILRIVSHPSIIKLYEVYESDEKIMLIFELLTGGELFDRIIQKKRYEEKNAALLVKKLMNVLVYLEKKKIVHRDIKLENIMMVSQNDDINIKLADFGLAKEISQINPKYKSGTPGYVAPEVLLGLPYDYKVDIFSSGVLLYMLLSGRVPFPGKNFEEVLRRNKKPKLRFSPNYWSDRSPESINLVIKMMSINPRQRYSVQDVLESEWMSLQLGEELQRQTFNEEHTILTQQSFQGESTPKRKQSALANKQSAEDLGGSLNQSYKDVFDAKVLSHAQSFSLHRMGMGLHGFNSNKQSMDQENGGGGGSSPKQKRGKPASSGFGSVHFDINSKLSYNSFYNHGAMSNAGTSFETTENQTYSSLNSLQSFDRSLKLVQSHYKSDRITKVPLKLLASLDEDEEAPFVDFKMQKLGNTDYFWNKPPFKGDAPYPFMNHDSNKLINTSNFGTSKLLNQTTAISSSFSATYAQIKSNG